MAKKKRIIGAGLILGVAVFILAGCVPADMYGENPFFSNQQPASYNNYYMYQPPVVYHQPMVAYQPARPNYWRRYQRRRVYWNHRRNQRWYRNYRQRRMYRNNGRGAAWGNRNQGRRRVFRNQGGAPGGGQFRRTRVNRSFTQGPRFNPGGGTRFRSRGGGGGGGGRSTRRRWRRP
ncbi:MAG: hypothetical protein KJ621_14195 [Proteobacteria bacterium]|nr:hypothetical protein [Pseudomonadota bacterium]MBU1740967.1 hypothetical protein [Pseudomonadota bacterium]